MPLTPIAAAHRSVIHRPLAYESPTGEGSGCRYLIVGESLWMDLKAFWRAFEFSRQSIDEFKLVLKYANAMPPVATMSLYVCDMIEGVFFTDASENPVSARPQ